MTGISVVINTLNEEHNLPFVLASVKSWVQEIIVVDMHSQDRTAEIARSFGARVFMHEPLGYADPARAFAIQQATQPWILMLDADELIPYPLSRRLLELSKGDEYDVIDLPWVNYLFGQPINQSGWGPHQDHHMRFFRRGMLNSNSNIHNFLQPAKTARILRLPYCPGEGVIHFNYTDIHHFLYKMNRYTDIEANRINASNTTFWLRAVLHPPLEFLKRFIVRNGYRDGKVGWTLAVLMSYYRGVSYLKAYQISKMGDAKKIQSSYDEIARKIVNEYDKQ